MVPALNTTLFKKKRKTGKAVRNIRDSRFRVWCLGQDALQRRYTPGRALLAYGMTKHKYCTQLRAGGSNYKSYRILPGYILLSPPSGSPAVDPQP